MHHFRAHKFLLSHPNKEQFVVLRCVWIYVFLWSRNISALRRRDDASGRILELLRSGKGYISPSRCIPKPQYRTWFHVTRQGGNTGLITNQSKPSLKDLRFTSPPYCMWIIVIFTKQWDRSNRPGPLLNAEQAWLDMVAGCSTLRAISIITQQSNHCEFLQLLISADNQPVFWSVLDPQGWTGAVMRLIATNATEVCSERTFPSGPAISRSLYRWEEKKTCPAFGSVLSETLWRARMPDILTTLLT